MPSDRPLRVALDIGGVISKYPDVIRAFAQALTAGGAEVYVITDMLDHARVCATLARNAFDFIDPASTAPTTRPTARAARRCCSATSRSTSCSTTSSATSPSRGAPCGAS